MGQFDESEYFLVLTKDKEIRYFYFDFFEIESKLKTFDEEIKSVNASNKQLLIELES